MSSPSIDVECVFVFPPVAHRLIAMLADVSKVDGCVCTWQAQDCFNTRWEIKWTLVGPRELVTAFKKDAKAVIEAGWDHVGLEMV